MTVYILEFDRPLGTAKHQARFYIGSCRDDLLDSRMEAHRTGAGAAITRAAALRGIGFKVVATLPGGRQEERKLKSQKNARRIVERYQRAKN